MGSWYETDFLTNLPIQDDDEVMVFFLEQQHGLVPTSSITYSHDIYRPIGIPIQGWYDDYGRYKLNEGDIVYDHMLEHLRSKVMPMEEGSNRYHEKAVIPETMTWENVFENIHEERLKTHSHYNGSKNHIVEVAIHRSIYDMMSEECTTWKGTQTWNDEYQDLKAKIAKAREDIDNGTPERIASAIMRMEIGEILGRFAPFDSVSFKDMYYAAVDDGQEDHYLRALAKMKVFNTNLSMLRKSWMPQAGTGSQDAEFELHIKLNGVVTMFAHNKKRSYDE
ncbi:coil containing protein [Vibrio phage 2.275.O._10N.286.54.E11]|nr:coil containing protein [Vibrio phage 2.275.O._10N.286.54.E11]